jgi:uncharacterized protein YndB with AHSA1/START domain
MGDVLRISDAGARIEIDRGAPVVGAAETSIGAPITTVWRLLSDLERWPEWNRDISMLRLDGPVQAGTTFRWRSGSSRIVSCLEEVEAPHRIAWTGRTMGIRAVHVFELEEADRVTRVRTEESFEGLVARAMRRALRKRLARDLAEGLGALKIEAERQATIGDSFKENAPLVGQVH